VANIPFQSEAQRRFLWSKHPEIAKKWSHESMAKKKKKRKYGSYSKEAIDYARGK
jgi:hypothetical protein